MSTKDLFLSLPSSPLSLLFADLVASLQVYLNMREYLLNWNYTRIFSMVQSVLANGRQQLQFNIYFAV